MSVFGTAIGNLVKRTVLFYDIGGQKIGFIQLDATVRENHTRKAKVTQNEVEDGTNVADNVVLANETFQIEGIISEAPLPSSDIRDIALTVQNAGFGALSSAVKALSGGLITDAGAALKRVIALVQLENFWRNRIPFTVLTGLKKYDNVIITSLSIPVTPKDGASLRFIVDCEVVRIVSSQTISIPENRAKDGAAHSSTEKQSLGKQTKAAANANESGKGSILFNLYKKVSA